jgi:hypothetical protein
LLFALGTAILAAPERWIRFVTGGGATRALYDAFAYDEEFLRLRGPIVLALLVFGVAMQATLAVVGRRRPWLYTTEMVYSLVLCATLTAVLAAGPVFQADPTDQMARGAVAMIVLITLADTAVRARRHHVRQAVRGLGPVG